MESHRIETYDPSVPLKIFRIFFVDFEDVFVGVEPKIGGFYHPKMDGENNGTPYFLMDDLGGPPLYLETPICRWYWYCWWKKSG